MIFTFISFQILPNSPFA